ncbi:hypothetical protein Y032_0631g868 [Ancylostoma ceylanicum]|uniref:Uncharacterized protein n=1 Tax=Ancylostoma ceylanicum TaxID=53326 RepID=A0A016WJU6_9BILA|nr:hypothetical protein Y032_0631g868 [Ancylostoma ceylanicum]
MRNYIILLLISFISTTHAQFGGIYGYDYGYGIPPPVPPPPYPMLPQQYGYGYGYGYNAQPGSVESIVGGALMGTAFGLLFGKKK